MAVAVAATIAIVPGPSRVFSLPAPTNTLRASRSPLVHELEPSLLYYYMQRVLQQVLQSKRFQKDPFEKSNYRNQINKMTHNHCRIHILQFVTL